MQDTDLSRADLHLLKYIFFLLIAGHLWQLLFSQNSPLADLRILCGTPTCPLSRFFFNFATNI